MYFCILFFFVIGVFFDMFIVLFLLFILVLFCFWDF
nr:MAG TPA: hypothetical protein [Bacteriophage sp.]